MFFIMNVRAKLNLIMKGSVGKSSQLKANRNRRCRLFQPKPFERILPEPKSRKVAAISHKETTFHLIADN